MQPPSPKQDRSIHHYLHVVSYPQKEVPTNTVVSRIEIKPNANVDGLNCISFFPLLACCIYQTQIINTIFIHLFTISSWPLSLFCLRRYVTASRVPGNGNPILSIAFRSRATPNTGSSRPVERARERPRLKRKWLFAGTVCALYGIVGCDASSTQSISEQKFITQTSPHNENTFPGRWKICECAPNWNKFVARLRNGNRSGWFICEWLKINGSFSKLEALSPGAAHAHGPYHGGPTKPGRSPGCRRWSTAGTRCKQIQSQSPLFESDFSFTFVLFNLARALGMFILDHKCQPLPV